MTVSHYKGGCQCGAVTFEADVDLDKTVACNCSRCRRLGSVLAFAPESDFHLISGEENLSEYLFNKKAIHHLFCKTCGIESFARAERPDGVRMIAVNANCLDGVDARALSPKHYDGASV
ncbi:GFA family protein [Oryzifoliimicrobium ureilyticus]|uniref:GFA family protein n=1 Tax=Oryzifoliimicrobium ureilyticus TaxID=3113724 RepID=UPI0030767DCA